jgi:hypothetical protein
MLLNSRKDYVVFGKQCIFELLQRRALYRHFCQELTKVKIDGVNRAPPKNMIIKLASPASPVRHIISPSR